MKIIPYESKRPLIKGEIYIMSGAVILGDVRLHEGCSIWSNCVLRGDVDYIEVGKNTNLQDGTIVHCDSSLGPVKIGDMVTVGHMCLLHSCILENFAFIGMGSIVMDGAKIESNAMLAAGSLLTRGKIVCSKELWGGRPAKFMRMLSEDEIAGIKTSATEYVKLAKKYNSSYSE